MNEKVLERIIQEAYDTLLAICIPLDKENVSPTSHAGGKFYQYRTHGWDDERAFVLGEGIPAFHALPSRSRAQFAMGCVHATYREGNTNLDRLREVAHEAVRDWRRRPVSEYDVWIHLDIRNVPDEIELDRINGTPLEVVGLPHMLSRGNVAQFNDLDEHDEALLSRCVRHLVCGRYRARDPEEALGLAGSNFEVLRGAFNWHYHMTYMSKSFGGTREQCHHYKPLMFGVAEVNSPPQYYRAYDATEAKQREVASHNRKALQTMLKYLAPKFGKNTIRSKLGQAIALFGQGLDSIYPAQQFLSMWNALERVALVDGGSPTEIARRLPKLWANGPDSEVAFVLSRLAPLRNDLVHQGEFDHDNDEAVVWLRIISSQVFWRLVGLHSKLKTVAALNGFYAGFGIGKTELEERIRGLEESLAMQYPSR